ncbi:MAG: ubiquitin carboxyl-terminal hydrolase family protein, partial [archaeon]|nr:ubiquitin carboxyl-terminal hydrolase family protein [archaeon]
QKNTKSVQIHLYPADPLQPPSLYILSVAKTANFGFVRQQISELSGIPAESICLTDVSYRKIWSMREDYKTVASLLDNDVTYGFVVPPIEGTAAEQAADPVAEAPMPDPPPVRSIYDSTYPARPPPKPAKHVRFQVVHRRCIRYSDGFVHRTLFHSPMVFSLPIAEATNARVQKEIRTWLNDRILLKEFAIPLEEPTTPQAADIPEGEEAQQQQQQQTPDYGFSILVGSHTAAQLPELPFDEQPFRVRDWVHDVISIDWADSALDRWNKATSEEVIEHDSAARFRAAQSSRASVITLHDCLELNARKEQLTADNMWYCSKCGEQRQASKQLLLWKIPPYICIHLKRFQYTSHYRDRIDDHVDFPLDGLDLREFVKGPQAADLPLYDLYGVSNHMGGMGGGHYTAYVRNPVDGAWYSCNDSSVHPVGDPSRIVSSAAYLLFYKARTASNHITLSSE